MIGREARRQMLERAGRLPDAHGCLCGRQLECHRVVPPASRRPDRADRGRGGRDIAELGHNAATIGRGTPGVLHGSFSFLLQDDDGQIQETHSVSAGLDYPGVGPEHSWLAETGRVTYESATDEEALAALYELGRHEGILPALESSHALVGAKRWLGVNPGSTVLVGLSGRGDKDIDILRGLNR